MRRITAILLLAALVLSLAACGGKAPAAAAPVDLSAVYTECEGIMVEMVPLDDNSMMTFFGLDAKDCAQAYTAICSDGMRADEIWLLEAKDDAAMARLTEIAKNRLTAKADETESYNPEQYAVVQKAELITKGRYLALLVAPEVEDLKKVVDTAIQ